MAFLVTEDQVKSTVPLFEGIAPQLSSTRNISDRDLASDRNRKSSRLIVGPYSEEKAQSSFKDIASGRKSQFGIGSLGNEIRRLKERIGINSKPHKMDSMLRVFREKPAETGFVELEGVGEELKVHFNLDQQRNRRRFLQDMRARNVELKARIEERIIEYNERRRRSEEMNEGFEAVEIRQRKEKFVQSDRLQILNEMLGETKFVAQSELDHRIKLSDFFRNDQTHQLEHKKLLAIMNSEAQKYNNEVLDNQIKLSDEIQTAQQKSNKQHEADIKISEEYLINFKKRVRKVLKLKHLDGGPKNKMVERLQIMRRINPKSIENRVKLETEELHKKMKPSIKSTVSISKQKFAEILEHQANQKKHQLTLEKDSIFREKSLKEPSLSIQFSSLPYFASKEHMKTKESLPESGLRVTQDSAIIVQESSPNRSKRLPALHKRLSGSFSSKQLQKPEAPLPQQSLKTLHLPMAKRSQAEQLALEDRVLELLQDCLRLQVEDIQDNTVLRQLISSRPKLTKAEEDEIQLMKGMLRSARDDEATARMNHAFERHFKRQNKFGSIKIFKEHYVQVIGNVMKLQEMDGN
jgi:hypothetical protein